MSRRIDEARGLAVTGKYQNIWGDRCGHISAATLNQVWINLIHNALQAMDNCGVFSI
ncbi:MULTISPECIES: hypothetical protein [Microcoleaceae]|uniref:hypothetical protein n=1 Tax=Microcoleaceae TaxID=1892252 RepID=UPI00187E869A|nr:hypothetical protein [Tychonema sp. LEGE 06208]MBE9161009.1 hypothetical protein [Tychonema sp. LEGE 06208]